MRYGVTFNRDAGRGDRAAGNETGFAAADFPRVRNANYGRFTLDRLTRMLHALDKTVEVSVDVH